MLKRVKIFLKSRSLWATAVKVILYAAMMFFLVILPDRPHNYKVLSAIILIFGIFFVFVRLRQNKKYSGENYLRLRHENDGVEKMMSLSIGGLLILGSAWYIIATGQIAGGALVCCLLGLFLLFNGMTYKNTVLLRKEPSRITQMNDPEVHIEREKISKLTIHLNQIVVEKGNREQPFRISFLELKNPEIEEIRKWFLKTSE